MSTIVINNSKYFISDKNEFKYSFINQFYNQFFIYLSKNYVENNYKSKVTGQFVSDYIFF